MKRHQRHWTQKLPVSAGQQSRDLVGRSCNHVISAVQGMSEAPSAASRQRRRHPEGLGRRVASVSCAEPMLRQVMPTTPVTIYTARH